MELSRKRLAQMIDSTMVKATATRWDIERLCSEARQYDFACVCKSHICLSSLKTFEKNICEGLFHHWVPIWRFYAGC